MYRKPEHNFWDYKKVAVLCNLVCQCQEIHARPISEKFYSPEYTLFLCMYTNLHKWRAYLFLIIWCRCSHEASIWNAQIFINNRMDKQIVFSCFDGIPLQLEELTAIQGKVEETHECKIDEKRSKPSKFVMVI